MNERIKQLAKQAEEYADIEYNASDLDWYELKEEKFAELIVQECTKILADNGEFRGCVIIGKHFGVEE